MNLSRIIKTALLLGVLACGTRSAFAQATEPFIGQIIMVPYDFAPQGWALCEGQLLSINQNQALFSLLGTTYGGDGRTNFALPDLRGRFPLGTGGGPGLTSRFLGEEGGAENYTLTIAQLPAHTHPIMASSAEAAATSPGGNILAAKARVPLYQGGAPDVAMSSQSVAPSGGSQPHPVMPPFTSVRFIIALQGVYPSRN